MCFADFFALFIAAVTFVHFRNILVKHAPSGTALMLANAIKEVRPEAEYVYGRGGEAKRTKNEIGIHALRMANIVGEHEVYITTDTQQLVLRHNAYDRALFADGAVKAATFLVGQDKGLYTMQDMFKN